MEAIFSHIIGNETAKRHLINAYKKQALAQGLLFFGAPGIGKSLFAEATASLLLSNGGNNALALKKVKERSHPDFHIISPEGKSGMHSIESIRAMIDDVNYAPFEAEYKVYLIEEAHRMLPYSANALLKTLEEPGKNILFILVTDQKEHLLPTIQSRLRTLYFNNLSDEEIEFFLIDRMNLAKDRAREIALSSRGSIGWALRLLNDEKNFLFKTLLETFSQKRFSSYGELSKKCSELASYFEQIKETLAEELKVEIEKGFQMEELKAKDRQSLEKELEGALAAKMSFAFRQFFEEAIFWFRDQHLMYHGVSRQFLIHKKSEKELREGAFEKEPLSLNVLQKAAHEAWIGISRGLIPNHVLENFFIKLGFLG